MTSLDDQTDARPDRWTLVIRVLTLVGLVLAAVAIASLARLSLTWATGLDHLRNRVATDTHALTQARHHQAETDARVSQLSDYIASTGNTVPPPTTTTTVRHATTTTSRPRTAPKPTSTTTAPGTSTTAPPPTSQPTTTTTRPCSIGVPGDGCLVR